MTTLYGVKIQTADVPNKNGRTYPIEGLQRVVEEAKMKKAFGQVGMPSCEGMDFRFSEISHEIDKLRIEDGALVGDITVLETPAGTKLAVMIEEQEISFRVAGYGVLNGDVVDDFILHSVNAVPTKDAA